MEQLPSQLKDAAHNYATHNYHDPKEITISKTTFEAAAEWQKEQYKELIILMRQLLIAYDFRYPDTKQLLVGYTNKEAFEKLNTLLEHSLNH